MLRLVDGKLVEVTRQTAPRREVYFVRAVTLGLIKIGVADDARARLRTLANQSPDRLAVLGVMICDRGGATEPDLHQRFARWRVHGEWFDPAPELLDFIEAHGFNPARTRVLQAVVDLPTLPRGRPSKARSELIRNALQPNPGKTGGG